MREQRQADAIEPGTGHRVDEEADGRHRQDPADAAPRSFEHEEDGQRAEHDVDAGADRPRGRRSARNRPAARRARRSPSATSEQRESSRSDRRSWLRPRAPAPPSDEQEREHQRDQQEADAVHLGLDDEEDPVERVQRQPDRQGRRQASRMPDKLPDWRFVRRRYCGGLPFSRYQRSAPG